MELPSHTSSCEIQKGVAGLAKQPTAVFKLFMSLTLTETCFCSVNHQDTVKLKMQEIDFVSLNTDTSPKNE